MRLDNRRSSDNIEDRRDQSDYTSGRRITGGRKGGILGLLVVLVGAYYGVDLTGVMGYGDTSSVSYQQSSSRLSAEEEQQLYNIADKVLAATEDTWGAYFKQNGLTYREPKLVLYRDGTQTACGTGQSAMGPFYCPADQKVYLDLSFYDDMRKQLKASGDFAFAYVIAHEIGHHVQNQLGITQKTQRAQQQARSRTEANKISIAVELQADCFAGVWGHQFNKEGALDARDIEEAFVASQAVGDDRLQKQAQGYAVPDSFTHGTSAQRLAWFRKGLEAGNPSVCNTFTR